MAVFEVESGAPLMGEATIHPAKNAALPVIAAALLTADELVVPDMPDLTDVRAMCELIEACGASVRREGADLVHRHAVGLNLAVDAALTDAAGDQQVILPAEVQNQNFFHLSRPPGR